MHKKKNITKTGPGSYSIRLEKQVLGAPEMRVNQADHIVNWGRKNDYPFRLIDLYVNSVTHHSCVDFAVNAIAGNGVDLEAMKMRSEDLQAPNYHTSWDAFIRAIAFDFVLYGGFAFQVIKNKDGKTYSFFNQPFETVRFEQMDEDGVIPACWISADWTAKQKFPPQRIPLFGFQEDEEIPAGQVYMFVYISPNPVSPYYPIPTYIGGLKSIQAECEYLKFDLKSILNGFVASGAISCPPMASDEQKQAMVDNIQRMLTGSENANSIMVTFREDSNDDPVRFTPFSMSNDAVDLYDAANDRCVTRIISAHKISSRGLIGLPMDDSGFSDSGNLLETALQVYNVNVANANRTVILSVLNNAFRLNSIETEIVLKPLSYVSVTSAESTVGEPVNDDEATEREGGAASV